MKKINVSLCFQGFGEFEIEIFTNENPEQFVKKMEANEYVGTIFGGDILDVKNDMKKVGKMVLDKTEYYSVETHDYELRE
jgi:hypothetical protein